MLPLGAWPSTAAARDEIPWYAQCRGAFSTLQLYLTEFGLSGLAETSILSPRLHSYAEFYWLWDTFTAAVVITSVFFALISD